MSVEIAARLQQRIDELGLRLDVPGRLVAVIGDSPWVVPGLIEFRGVLHQSGVVYLREMTMESLASRVPSDRMGSESLLVLGPRITERSAALLRKLKINYLDEAGNASIRFDTVLIDVRGRRPAVKPSLAKGSSDKRSGAVNLFSTKRAQVIFVLLQWPELANTQVRIIAHAAQVSLGQVHDTLSLLQELGYLDSVSSSSRRLRRTSELLDLWASSYASGLRSSVSLYELEGSSPDFQQGLDWRIFVSGEAAVPEYLRPETLTLYIEKPSAKELIVANRWRSGPNPNVFLQRRFWNDPHEEETPFSNSSKVLPAPAVLVYADLLASSDSRQKNVAQLFREENVELRKL